MAHDLPNTDDYFLSATNPIANTDQLACEEMALRLWERPDVHAARDHAALLWQRGYGVDVPAEAEPTFQQAVDEYVFNWLLKAAASDGNNPRIVRDFMPPHRWFDRDVRGARTGGDNPDNCYRVVGIDHRGRYRVTVTPWGVEPKDVTFTLTANYGTSKTVQTLQLADAVRDADGGFVIEIDDRPTDGRPNHLRSTPRTVLLFVRDTMSDWSVETPLALRIERLDPVDTPPISDDEAAARAIDAFVDDVPLYFWFTRLGGAAPLNTIMNPVESSSLGGLISQAGVQARLQLTPDQAIIVRMDPAGAAYTSFTLQDWWFRTIDYDRYFSSITSAQARCDPDGTFTAVVSINDPGVHNWIETGGLHNLLVVARWHVLPKVKQGDGPTISMEMVPFDEVRDRLGASAFPVTPDERARQRAERAEGYRRRITC